jgi:uncharacterized membrane protein
MLEYILFVINVTGVGMLLGGAVYESVVLNPNYRKNIPDSLVSLREFMMDRTPADYFRILSPVAIISLLISVIINWGTLPGRWWIIASFFPLIIADTITFRFHYPRNKVMFIDPLIKENELLKKYALQWQTGNIVRILLIAISIICLMCGIFFILK